MSLINKGAFFIVSFILGVYYGILPLIGFTVWVRNSGWISMDYKQALLNITISIVIIIFIKYKKMPPKNTKMGSKMGSGKDGVRNQIPNSLERFKTMSSL